LDSHRVNSGPTDARIRSVQKLQSIAKKVNPLAAMTAILVEHEKVWASVIFRLDFVSSFTVPSRPGLGTSPVIQYLFQFRFKNHGPAAILGALQLFFA
jgi:hypothetical protein